MTAAVRIQPQGESVQYPNTQWSVSFVEDAAGKFRFLLCGRDFKFEPRDYYRYPSHDDARRVAHCFLFPDEAIGTFPDEIKRFG